MLDRSWEAGEGMTLLRGALRWQLCQQCPWNAWAEKGVPRAILDQQGACRVAIKSNGKEVGVRVSRALDI